MNAAGLESGVAICARLHPEGCQCSVMAVDSKLEAYDRGLAIDAYIRAYMAATGAKIKDIELVEQRHTEENGNITVSWYCRPKKGPPLTDG